MSTNTLPSHLAAKADSIQAHIRSRLPESTILPKDLELQLDSTSLITPESGYLTARQLGIIALDAVGLVEALSRKDFTAEEVTEAYSISASIAHQTTNCLTWYDSESALAQAKALDASFGKTGEICGPLHGVVISLKQLINVEGWPQSASHLNFEEFLPEKDGSLVHILRQAGAVFMVQTTQPQSIMHLETISHKYGTTLNAYNRNCTSGGSSGGEGAIVAMRGSTLGVGTDIGGSIRNPSAFNGLWGFKTTSKRLPRDGPLGGLSGGTSLARIRGCIGPMTRSLRDMDLFIRIVMNAQCWKLDTSLLPLPWREVDIGGKGIGYDSWSGNQGKLRVGVMRDDGHVRPVKSIQRVMEGVVGDLKAGGVEVVDVEPRDFKAGWDLITKLFYIDGGKKLRESLVDEPLLPLTEWIISQAPSSPLSGPEIDTLVSQRDTLRQDWLTYFRSLEIDILLLPAGPAPAQVHGTTKYWSYTSMFNLLDWPAAVFPTGKFVDPAKDQDSGDLVPRNEDEEHLYKTYSAETSVGCPIGLQVVAPKYEDERLMAALKVIEHALSKA